MTIKSSLFESVLVETGITFSKILSLSSPFELQIQHQHLSHGPTQHLIQFFVIYNNNLSNSLPKKHSKQL